jgi:glycosyltransferase involved in cell wall biosynthesis
MNVLHLIDSGGLYGAENVVLNLMHRQLETGVKTTLGSIGTKADGQKAIEKKAAEVGLSVKVFRMRNGPNVSGAIRIYKYAHKNNVDIVHCHGYKATILSGLLPFRYGKIPYISTLHGWTSTKKYTKMWFYEWLDAMMVKRADRVVAVSQAMRENLRLKVLNINPVVIYNGIQNNGAYNIVAADSNLLKGFDNKKLKLISIGRLSKEKGFNILLNAVHHIKTKWNHDVRLFIVGEGPEKGNLMRLAQENGIGENVIFPGYMENACKVLKCFDIFVMSSLTEGMPITLLEAMRAGMPIVATAVGGIPEALEGGKCGRLVPSGSDLDLAYNIVELYENRSLREELSAKAKIRFQEEFTVEKMEEKYRTVYVDVINKSNKNNRKDKNT